MQFHFLRTLFVLLLILGFVASESRAQAPALAGQLTTTGDVVFFDWSPRGDFVLLARVGETLHFSPTRAQQTTDLYHLDLRTRVQTLFARDGNLPALDASGERVAYYVFRPEGTAALHVSDLAVRTTRELGAADGSDFPVWSSDGRSVFVTRQGRTVSLARENGAVQQTFPRAVTTSPDGTRAAYADRDGLHLIVGPSDTLVFRLDSGEAIANQLVWSHDSIRLAFVVERVGLVPELWSIARDGTEARQLARGETEYIGGIAWTPRDDALVFVRTPTGSNVAAQSELWRAEGVTRGLTRLTFDEVEETQPRLSPDGNSIAFLRDGNVFVLPLSDLPPPTSNFRLPISEIPPAPPLLNVPLAPTTQLTPPATIRVIHTAENASYPNCRPAIPIGQIDVITFETYVKWVTPAEMPAFWAGEALKTQAVAARTYGWWRVLNPVSTTYDIRDSTADQAMCPNKVMTSTNVAVDATRGQYVAFNNAIIFAQYGAESSDPTTSTTSGYPYNQYLIAVDDPVGFGYTRSGHGRGMSQWGAQRWATQYDWNYQQILLHYYSNVTLEAPFAPAPDITAPIGSLFLPWSRWGMISNRAFLVANASDNSSNIAGMDFTATYNNGMTTTIAHVTDAPWQTVWDLSAQADQNPITISIRITDAAGISLISTDTRLPLDRIPPTGTLTMPSATTTPTITLNLNASDAGTSGLSAMAFSNDWIWEGENQQVDMPGGQPSGSVVSDSNALNGFAMRGQVGTNPAGFWFGPYTTALPVGQKYRAYFRLKIDNVLTTTEVAMLDVVKDAGATILGIKRLRGTDFRTAGQYQEFYADFYHNQPCAGYCLEFRVAYRARANLWLDRVIVVTYPEPYAATKPWRITNGYGQKRVLAKFLDSAGNISADTSALVMYLSQIMIPMMFR